MSEYTKGPWHVEYELDEDNEKTDVLYICHPETSCDLTTVASIMNVLGTEEENKTNAYLIAAAPDLLEALEGMLKVFCNAPNVKAQDSYEAAEVAISKAKGGLK